METETETQAPVQETVPEAGEETPQNGATPAEVAAAEETQPEPTVFDRFREAADRGDIDLYEVEELPSVKRHLERRDRQRQDEITNRLEAEYRQKTAKWESTQAADKLAGYVGGLLEKIENADLPGAERLYSRLESFAAENLRNVVEFAKAEGRDAAEGVARQGLYNELIAGLDRRGKDEFQDGLRPNMSWSDAIELRDKLKFGPKEAEYKRQLEAKDDTIGKLKAEGRSGAGPNLAQSTPGGAGINTYEEASRRYNLPIGHPDKLSHEAFKEQRARFGRQT